MPRKETHRGPIAWRVWWRWKHLQHRLQGPCSAPQVLVPVFAHPRTGSGLLMDYLSSLPRSAFQDEVLHPGGSERPPRWDRRSLLQHLRAVLWTHRQPIVGLKIQLYQWYRTSLTPQDLGTLAEQTRPILLYRRNLLAQFLSYEKAMASGEWSSLDPKAPLSRKAPTLDLTRFERFSTEIRTTTLQFLSDFECLNPFVLSYEELTEEGDHLWLEPMSRFLGVEPFEPQSQRRKQGPEEVPAFGNSDEVQERLAPEDYLFRLPSSLGKAFPEMSQ